MSSFANTFYYVLKRNPFIKIYGLPWSFPGWLNPKGERDPYRFPNMTSQYIIKWINGAKNVYGITVDYIGVGKAE